MGLLTRDRPQKGITPEQPHKGGDEPPRLTRTAPMDVEVKTSKRGTLRRIWRWTVNITVVLFLFAGFMQVIGQPVLRAINNTGATVKATTVDTPAAQETAVRAVTDWLTYNPQALSAYRSIVGARFGSGAAASAWSGSAWMAPDVVTAGTVVTQPDGDLVTQVRARVRIATPAQSTDKPTPPQATSGDPGNDPTVPAGWTVVSTQWLHLLVPITGQGRPDPAGPVLATANEARTTEATGSTDSAATASSQPWAVSLFTAVAGTDPTALGYLTTNPLIIPLNGQVEFNGVTAWQITDQAEGDTGTIRQGTGTVSWKFPGVDLAVKQTYTVEAEQAGGRWFATTITPTTTGGTA